MWCPECDPDGPKSTRRSIAMEPRLWCPEADPEARLCDNCSRALQKPLVCAQCKTATYCSKDCQMHYAYRKRGGIAIKAVIDYSNAHTNTNVTE